MIKEQWGPKMVDFYLSLYFFSFFKQRGILGYAIQTSIIVFKGMVKKEIKKNRKGNHTNSEYFTCFSINSRFVNLFFTNILSRLANMLGQFPNFINLICSLNKVVYTCVWDFFVSWLKESGNYMCGAHFMS